MITVIGDLQRSLVGVWRLLRGDDDFPNYFDVSAAGFWRSFAAAGFALPVFFFILAAQMHALREMGVPVEQTDCFGLAYGVLVYAAVWLHFPVIASGLVILADRSSSFAPWVVVHNWTVLALIAAQAIAWLFYLNGLLPAQGAAELTLRVYLPLSLLVHWRVAMRALDVGWSMAAGLACAHVLINQLLQYAITMMFQPPAS